MSQAPSIDYKCTQCGARQIYELVPQEARPAEDEFEATPHEIPSIDFRCSRCGASQTYKLVPEGAARAPR
jgi:DNA-directed RNA polymerase subunit RPC12/RpoP